MFQRVTKGAMSGNAGEPAKEDFKINGQYVDTPRTARSVVGIPFFDGYVEKAALDFLDRSASPTQPFFMSVNFMKVHQPNMPASGVRAQVAVEEQICRFRRRTRHPDRPHPGQAPRARPRQEHVCVLHHRQRRLAGRLSRRRLHAFRGTKGTVREGGNRVPPCLVARQGQGRPKNSRHRRRPRSDGHLRLPRRRQAAGERPRGQADHLRQLRHVAGPVRHRQVGAQVLVLLHRERTFARCGPRRQLQGRVQSARR